MTDYVITWANEKINEAQQRFFRVLHRANQGTCPDPADQLIGLLREELENMQRCAMLMASSPQDRKALLRLFCIAVCRMETIEEFVLEEDNPEKTLNPSVEKALTLLQEVLD
jgi:uncharacterized membrane protein YccC